MYTSSYANDRMPTPKSASASARDAASSPGDKQGTEAKYLSDEYYEEAISNFNDYEPELWLPTLSVTMSMFMAMPWLLITLLTLALTWYVETFASPAVRSIFSIPTDAHVVLGSALSFLIVFRTNSSYDRWWAARNMWDEMCSHCQSLSVLTAPCLDTEEHRLELINLLMCFVVVCKNWLREEPTDPSELSHLLDWQQIHEFEATPCPPLAVVDAMACTIRESVRQSELGSAQAGSVVIRSEAHLDKMCDDIGTCDKIKSTPMVYGYVATLRTFLIMWLSTLPMALIGEYGWLATPVVSLLAFLFLNIEQMAIEIEQPFGHDANDLPVEGYILELEKWMMHMRPALKDGGKAHHRRPHSPAVMRRPPPPAPTEHQPLHQPVYARDAREPAYSEGRDLAYAEQDGGDLQPPLQQQPRELACVESDEAHGAGRLAHGAEMGGRPPLYDAGAASRVRPPSPPHYGATTLSQQPYAHSTARSFVPSSAAYKRYYDNRRWRPSAQSSVGQSCKYKYASLEQLARETSMCA